MCIDLKAVLFVQPYCVVSSDDLDLNAFYAFLPEWLHRPVHKSRSTSLAAMLWQHGQIIDLSQCRCNVQFAETYNVVLFFHNGNLRLPLGKRCSKQFKCLLIGLLGYEPLKCRETML